MDLPSITQDAGTLVTAFVLKAIGALVVWIIGRYLIGFGQRVFESALSREHVDGRVLGYLPRAVGVTLNVILVVAILGYFGLETTSFAALVLALGLAIGAAWAGLLANVAAGVLLAILRPFNAGDHVKAGGVEGRVKSVGLFATIIITGDNVTSFVGNNRICADLIQNFSLSPYRRIDRTVQLASDVDVEDAIQRLRHAIGKIPNVSKAPAVNIEIMDFTPHGPVLAVRPYAHTDHYWQVYFDTNRVIAKTLGEAGRLSTAGQLADSP